MFSYRIFIALAAGTLLALAGARRPASANGESVSLARIVGEAVVRRYGATVKLGNGEARSYVAVDATGAPTEVGVVLDETALEGLPAAGTGHHGGHDMPHTFLLDLPSQYGVPFRFIELNWNPSGHEPEGVYAGVPHFDFHFYVVEKEDRETIVPTDPAFADKAINVPAAQFVPPFTVPLAPPNAPLSAVAVPMMGVHWVDTRSHELQAVFGKPEAYRPFTSTFIHGSWDGKVIFWEPMITRAHILAKKTTTDEAVRDEIIPIATPAEYQKSGYYPAAYRITWDAEAKEFRIALTQLARQG